MSCVWVWLIFESRNRLFNRKNDMNFIIHSLCRNVENFTYANLPIHKKHKENVLSMKKILHGNCLSFVEVDIIWGDCGMGTSWQTCFSLCLAQLTQKTLEATVQEGFLAIWPSFFFADSLPDCFWLLGPLPRSLPENQNMPHGKYLGLFVIKNFETWKSYFTVCPALISVAF